MQLSITGEIAAERIPLRSLETIKWVAFALMLMEHFTGFVLQSMPHWVMAIGRNVFPLFALALAVGTAEMNMSERWRVVGRMIAAACVAAVAVTLVRDVERLNVLFTLAAGLALHTILSGVFRGRMLAAAAVLFASVTFEYGVAGVFAIYFLCKFAKGQCGRHALAYVAAATVLVCYANGNLYAVTWFPLALMLVAGQLELPRIRRFFYFGYIAQWPAFALLRAVL